MEGIALTTTDVAVHLQFVSFTPSKMIKLLVFDLKLEFLAVHAHSGYMTLI